MINHLTGNRPVTEENSTQTQEMREWTQAVTNQLNFLEIAVGTGSPEGVLVAGVNKLYRDSTGSAGSILYIKNLVDIAGDESKGWILV